MPCDILWNVWRSKYTPPTCKVRKKERRIKKQELRVIPDTRKLVTNGENYWIDLAILFFRYTFEKRRAMDKKCGFLSATVFRSVPTIGSRAKAGGEEISVTEATIYQQHKIAAVPGRGSIGTITVLSNRLLNICPSWREAAAWLGVTIMWDVTEKLATYTQYNFPSIKIVFFE